MQQRSKKNLSIRTISVKNEEIDLFLQEDHLTDVIDKNRPSTENLQQETGAAQAIVLIEAWIRTKLNGNDIQEKAWWGDNFSANIRNLGRAIGKKYMISDPNNPDSQIIIASYRADWDPTKGKHFNIMLTIPTTRKKSVNGKYVFKFGSLAHDMRINNIKQKPMGELEIITCSLQMTMTALRNQAEVPFIVADKFNRMMGITDKNTELYLQESGHQLTEMLVSAVKKTIEKERLKYETEDKAQREKEEQTRQLREEAERKAKEEAERKAKEEAERKAKEEAEREAEEKIYAQRFMKAQQKGRYASSCVTSFFGQSVKAIGNCLSYLNCCDRDKDPQDNNNKKMLSGKPIHYKMK